MSRHTEIYVEVLAEVIKDQCDPITVSRAIARLAECHTEASVAYGISNRAYHSILASKSQEMDKDSGKPMTASKAESLSKAEVVDGKCPYADAKDSELEKEAINVEINALKSVLSALTKSYGNSGY
jgi:hypothetical protein